MIKHLQRTVVYFTTYTAELLPPPFGSSVCTPIFLDVKVWPCRLKNIYVAECCVSHLVLGVSGSACRNSQTDKISFKIAA